MEIRIAKPFASSSAADEFDTRQIKKALNRLGYYTPPEKAGITGIPDAGVFAALKKFQKDSGLVPSGAAKPGDATVDALNEQNAKTPEGYYIWRTVGDERVRKGHAVYNRTVRAWSDSPDPGEEFNCRCWAEPVEEGLRPVYPELLLIPVFKLGRIFKILHRLFDKKPKDFTAHGSQRLSQRSISSKEVQDAIKSAKETNNVTVRTGKYGTPQNHYKGENGVTVIQETQGRNAGKIITAWRHQ